MTGQMGSLFQLCPVMASLLTAMYSFNKSKLPAHAHAVLGKCVPPALYLLNSRHLTLDNGYRALESWTSNIVI